MRKLKFFPFVIKLIVCLASAWIILFAILSFQYLNHLTHPDCPPSPSSRPEYQSITLYPYEDIALKGWWRVPQNGAVILLLGGLGSGRDSMLSVAEMLAQHGYGVATIDSRVCTGMASTLGYLETAEMDALLDFALAQPGVEWIGSLGLSVGGVAAIRGASGRPEIQAVIAEGNYANLYREFTATHAPFFSLQWQIQQMTAIAYAIQTGMWPGKISPISDLERVQPRPILLIAGESEAKRTQAEEQFKAAGVNAELWIIPNTNHGGYLEADPLNYESRVIGFLETARR